MIKESIGVAATIEEARQQALITLGAPAEAEVKLEILEQPKKKILGLFGGAQAKVKAYYDDGKKEKTEKKPVKEAPKAVEKKREEAPVQKKKESAKPEKKVEKKPAKQEPQKAAPAVKKEPEIDLSAVEAKESDATKYLEDILSKMGFDGAKVTVKEVSEDLYFEIASDEDYGNIIGRRGETLDALQYITRLFVNRASDDNKRVSLNVGDYRERRKETLKGLAARQAERALRIGRSCTLEPMNPYERRIIHTAIQGIDGVTSHSVGEGDNRRVVIIPENARDRRDRRNYGGRREKRAPYVPETPKEPREQKVDAVSSSRYGKIEPRKPAAPSSEEE